MKWHSVRLLGVGCSVAVLVVSLGCGKKSAAASPLAPSAGPATPIVTPKLETPAARTPVAGQLMETLKPTLSVSNAETTGAVGTVTYEFEVSEMDDFPAGSRTSSEKDIAQGGDGVTTWTAPSNLIANFTYKWHARATDGKITTEWTSTETFRTPNPARCDRATPDIFDPLTDGRSTCGAVIGGHFISGQGWMADTDTDGINIDIPTCISCTVEFDATNFGKKEGEFIQKDLKWISMGEASAFGGFSPFRDHPWKMHLEQRSDGDGTGMKLIWRNGDAGDGEPGDHTGKRDPAINWTGNTVWHFTLRWTPGGFSVNVGETQPDGRVINNNEWFADGFGGHAYAPGTLRISLGCYPRAETMRGAIFRNWKIYKN